MRLDLAVLFAVASVVHGTCLMHDNCNGHGECISWIKTCSCYDGYGSTGDVSLVKSADCSTRTCPAGKAWADVPVSATQAHALAECSNKGLCNRKTGLCECFPSFAGDACQRLMCPTATAEECSGHGKCVSMKRMAQMTNAFPLSSGTTYTGAVETTTWDEEMTFGCVCDSGWTVGLAAGERQLSEYFGVDCSFKRCPTGNDPVTPADETDCGGVVAAGALGTGAVGNVCHVDCSNRGICDYMSGICTCFPGYTTSNCGVPIGIGDGYVKEVQTFKCTASGGQFTVTLGSATAQVVAWNANFAALKASLEALDTVISPSGITVWASGSQTVACAASSPDTIYVQFDRNFGDIADLAFVVGSVASPSSSGLSGGTITQNAAGTFTVGVAPSA
jgi:hypothetical protein